MLLSALAASAGRAPRVWADTQVGVEGGEAADDGHQQVESLSPVNLAATAPVSGNLWDVTTEQMRLAAPWTFKAFEGSGRYSDVFKAPDGVGAPTETMADGLSLKFMVDSTQEGFDVQRYQFEGNANRPRPRGGAAGKTGGAEPVLVGKWGGDGEVKIPKVKLRAVPKVLAADFRYDIPYYFEIESPQP